MNHRNDSGDFLHSTSSHKYVQGHGRPVNDIISTWNPVNQYFQNSIYKN